MSAMTIRYPISDELYVNTVCVFDHGYLLMVSYADENYDSTDSFDVAQGYFNTINVSSPAEGRD